MTDNLKKRGQHEPRGKVKSSILEYLLNHDSPVEEPDLREHLRQKHGITEPKNINTHLQELHEKGCIKKYSEKGGPNRWNINSINQIRKIHELYPELQLTSHEKVLDLIANEHAPNPLSYHRQRIKEGIRSSNTFFELFLSKTKEEMHDVMKNYYLSSDEGLILKSKYNTQLIEKPLHGDEYEMYYKLGLIDKINSLELPYPIYKYEIIDNILKERIRNEIIDGTAGPKQIELLEKMELKRHLFDKEIESDSTPFKGFLYPKKDEDGLIYLEEKDLKYHNEADIKLAEEVVFRTVLQTIAVSLKNPTQFETVWSKLVPPSQRNQI